MTADVLQVGDRACILDEAGLRLWVVGRLARDFKLSATAWAQQNQLHYETLNGFLRGQRGPSETLLRAIGWEKVVLYRKADA